MISGEQTDELDKLGIVSKRTIIITATTTLIMFNFAPCLALA